MRGNFEKGTVAMAVLIGLMCCAMQGAAGQQGTDAVLPPGVRAVWDIEKAYREATPTRERVCINGLWRFKPARSADEPIPGDGWGYVKVPGAWPRGSSYDKQRLYPHPSWQEQNLAEINQAWHQREITIPASWAGRRIVVSTEYLNSYAAVYLDGRKMGELRFPWGEVDITSACRPGGGHVLTLYVAAVPLKEVLVLYNQTRQSQQVKGSVAARGLCGDVFLSAVPKGARVTDVKVETSVRKGELTLDVALSDLAPGKDYGLRALVKRDGETVKEMQSGTVRATTLEGGRYVFTTPWKPDRLWDTHTPQNMQVLELTLLDANGELVDAYRPVRFGFREFWIDGRDFRLNGSRIFLFVLPLENARTSRMGVAEARYEAARETMLRLKSVGVNAVYPHNYNCQPGVHVGMEEIFRAADDVGMLIALFQPHARSFDWEAEDADEANGYADLAEFYVRMAQNHPSVVLYAMNANMMGYSDAANPHHTDGLHNRMGEVGPRDDERAVLGRRTEAIVQRFDTTRPIYHHSSGNLSQMFTENHYINFVPIQERSDWFEHWAKEGAKPLFLTEYGAPSALSWTMHRGYPTGKIEGRSVYGNSSLMYQYCTAEWGAQFRGDAAFDLTEPEKRNMRYEAKNWRIGRPWKRWDYPFMMTAAPLGIPNLSDVKADYITDNWRAYRTWGVSAFNIWTQSSLFALREGADRSRVEFETDWDALQRPGFSPDFIDDRRESFEAAYEREDWIPVSFGKAFLRNNRPLLAYIGGEPGDVTSKDHNFLAGQSVRKQIIVINNSRVPVAADCSWSLALPEPMSGSRQVNVDTGEQARVPLELALPDTLPPGEYTLTMRVEFDTGETQEDAFAVHVLAPAPPVKGLQRVALFDPKGETGSMLRDLGVEFATVGAEADLSPYRLLIVGKGALTLDGPAPDVARVRAGLKVLVFEQQTKVLEGRLGFRVQEYGLRRVFKRVPDHPVLAGLENANLRDWRGEATTVPLGLDYEFIRWEYPLQKWCGLTVTRPWRSSWRGNVATALIEKPACGDFLPIVDGAFGLQYSPLMEWREGEGIVLFCQMDVTGRTEEDPAAQRLVSNLLSYMRSCEPGPHRKVLYAGEPAGKAHLEKAGLDPAPYEGGRPTLRQILVIGPGAAAQLAPHKANVAAWLIDGGHALAIGLNEAEANALLPVNVKMTQAEHINAYFEAAGRGSPVVGVGPADVHNRDPREIGLVTGGATPVGDGVLALANDGRLVFYQLVPWQFEYENRLNLKMPFRRAAFLVSRVLANIGAVSRTPLLANLATPVQGEEETRWLDGLYLDVPVELDDPYRFFIW